MNHLTEEIRAGQKLLIVKSAVPSYGLLRKEQQNILLTILYF